MIEPPDDIRLTFDRVPDLYTSVRPKYPPEFFDDLFERLPARPNLVEVGPGTGQATADLLDRGATVTAVEIGPHLAATLTERFAGSAHLGVVNASFEDADLPLGRFDGVVSATAYHWIDPRAQLTRPHELLTPNGWLDVIELIQVESEADRGYFERVQPIYAAFGDDSHRPLETYESAMPAIVGPVAESLLFEEPTIRRVPWDQTYTTAQYRDLLMTYSGTLMMPPAARDELVVRLTEVIDDEFGGTITRPLVATLTSARSTGRGVSR